MICSPVCCIYYTVLIFTFSGSIDERLQQQQTRIGGGNRISRDKASHLHRNKNNGGGHEIIMQQQQPPYNNRLPPRLNSKPAHIISQSDCYERYIIQSEACQGGNT